MYWRYWPSSPVVASGFGAFRGLLRRSPWGLSDHWVCPKGSDGARPFSCPAPRRCAPRSVCRQWTCAHSCKRSGIAMTILPELARSHWTSLAPSACRVPSRRCVLSTARWTHATCCCTCSCSGSCVNCEAQRVAASRVFRGFDTLISYFPISFTPPPNDLPNHVAASSVGAAAHATELKGFAQHALPFFAAKLRETEDDQSR